MDAVTSLKVARRCRLCGRRYPLGGRRMVCLCGGYIYTVSQIYQPKVRKGGKELSHGIG